MIDNSTKEQIKDELIKYLDNSESDNKASKALDVSNGYISQIRNNKYDGISDNMWRKISAGLGMKLSDQWMHADTRTYLALTEQFNAAQVGGEAFCIVAPPGSGKTYTMDLYRRKYRNVFFVKCQTNIRELEFLTDIYKSMGKSTTKRHITGILKDITDNIIRMDSPLIIIDEIERAKIEVLLRFRDLYDFINKKCGIVLIGTPNLKEMIENGVTKGKKGFNEVLSRLGGGIIEHKKPSKKDATEVIKANGITDLVDINAILNDPALDSDYGIDMRRVERLVLKVKLMQKEEVTA